MPTPKVESLYMARARLTEVTGTHDSEWRCSTDPVCGIGEEFFFVHKQDDDRFVYICIEDGVITSVECN